MARKAALHRRVLVEGALIREDQDLDPRGEPARHLPEEVEPGLEPRGLDVQADDPARGDREAAVAGREPARAPEAPRRGRGARWGAAGLSPLAIGAQDESTVRRGEVAAHHVVEALQVR